MKKGFTLIELLAVLVIIGIIAMISVPIVSSVIKNSRNGAYYRQIELIENAARTYMAKNSKELPSSCKALKIEDIKKAGLLTNNDIKDPRRPSKNINGYVIITFTSNKYVYKYSENNTCT